MALGDCSTTGRKPGNSFQPLSDSLPSRPSEPGTGSIRGKRILIVEDEILIAWELRRTIEEAGGIVVGLATSIAEARAAIVQTFADVAFLMRTCAVRAFVRIIGIAPGRAEHSVCFCHGI